MSPELSSHTRKRVAREVILLISLDYTWFDGWLVGFYGISTIVDYLMPNPLYAYILNIYDLVWLGFMAYQPL